MHPLAAILTVISIVAASKDPFTSNDPVIHPNEPIYEPSDPSAFELQDEETTYTNGTLELAATVSQRKLITAINTKHDICNTTLKNSNLSTPNLPIFTLRDFTFDGHLIEFDTNSLHTEGESRMSTRSNTIPQIPQSVALPDIFRSNMISQRRVTFGPIVIFNHEEGIQATENSKRGKDVKTSHFDSGLFKPSLIDNSSNVTNNTSNGDVERVDTDSRNIMCRRLLVIVLLIVGFTLVVLIAGALQEI